MNQIFQLPSNFTASTTEAMTGVFSNTSAYVTLIIGVFVSSIIVQILIEAIKPRH